MSTHAEIARAGLEAAGISGGWAVSDWAEEIVAEVAELVESGEHTLSEIEDLLHEIADGAVPIYTGDLMTLGNASIDLAAYTPDLGEPRSAEEAMRFTCYEVAGIVARCAFEDLARAESVS